MPIQVLRREDRRDKFADMVGQGLSAYEQYSQNMNRRKAMESIGLPADIPEDIAKQLISERSKRNLNPLQQSQQRLADERIRALQQEEEMFAAVTGGQGAEPSPQSRQQRPPPFKLEEPENENRPTTLRNATDEQLAALAGFAGQPGKKGIIGNNAKAEVDRRRREAEGAEKVAAEERKDARKISAEGRKREQDERNRLMTETAPVKKEISDRAELARRGIEGKEKLIDLINQGNLDDPTVATILEALPLNVGLRFLSPDTVTYKSGLVQNYGDLKTLFTGATRVKEIEILEKKIPDIYLTDSQKKAILLSSIDAHRADLLREETAAEMEKEDKQYGILEYRKELEKRVKPKLDALANRILDQQNAIIKDAENRKSLPLSLDDPEDAEIIDQILKEAGGDFKKAEKIAEKKGYKF